MSRRLWPICKWSVEFQGEFYEVKAGSPTRAAEKWAYSANMAEQGFKKLDCVVQKVYGEDRRRWQVILDQTAAWRVIESTGAI